MSEPEPDLGPLLQRFDVTRNDQRSVALVRMLSAVGGGICAVLLLLSDVPVPIFLAAVLGVLMALVWLGQARRALRLSQTAHMHHLSIYRAGVVVSEGAKLTTLRFAAVEAIEVDEERLDIVVKLHEGPLLRLEPRYPGVEIHALVHTLQKAWQGEAHHVGTGVVSSAVTQRGPR